MKASRKIYRAMVIHLEIYGWDSAFWNLLQAFEAACLSEHHLEKYAAAAGVPKASPGPRSPAIGQMCERFPA